jgi:hypothetical protein
MRRVQNRAPRAAVCDARAVAGKGTRRQVAGKGAAVAEQIVFARYVDSPASAIGRGGLHVIAPRRLGYVRRAVGWDWWAGTGRA